MNSREDIHPLFWQFVWFFSMEESAQEALIGPVDSQWFIEEDETNVGANYLLGVCLAFFEISPPWREQKLEPQIRTLRRDVNCLSNDLEPKNWAFRNLAKSEKWRSIRNTARALIQDSKTLVRPPRKPFKIEDIIHVDHFAHASIVKKSIKRSRTGG
jgi:hypothetical protein